MGWHRGSGTAAPGLASLPGLPRIPGMHLRAEQRVGSGGVNKCGAWPLLALSPGPITPTQASAPAPFPRISLLFPEPLSPRVHGWQRVNAHLASTGLLSPVIKPVLWD